MHSGRWIVANQSRDLLITVHWPLSTVDYSRASGGSRTHASAIPRRLAAVTTQRRHQQSAQWESNPHIRHGKATGSRYIMGANTNQSIRRGSHPRRHRGRVACCCYTTDALTISGSGGNRTHVCPLKRRSPRQRRVTLPFRHSPIRFSHRFRDSRTSGSGEESNPVGIAVGFGDRARSQA